MSTFAAWKEILKLLYKHKKCSILFEGGYKIYKTNKNLWLKDLKLKLVIKECATRNAFKPLWYPFSCHKSTFKRKNSNKIRNCQQNFVFRHVFILFCHLKQFGMKIFNTKQMEWKVALSRNHYALINCFFNLWHTHTHTNTQTPLKIQR